MIINVVRGRRTAADFPQPAQLIHLGDGYWLVVSPGARQTHYYPSEQTFVAAQPGARQSLEGLVASIR